MRNSLSAARSYAAGGHKPVFGWLANEAATTLITISAEQQRLGIHGGACEIGVYHGKLFVLLCLLLRSDERALGIDLFDLEPDDKYGANIRARLQHNLQRFRIDNDRAPQLTGNSLAMNAQTVIDAVGMVRIFSVDGGHSADEAAHDLSIAAGSLTEGGIVIVDDYFNNEWPAVAEGVCRFMADDDRLEPVAIAGNRFFFARGRAEEYRSVLQGERMRVFGQPVVIVPPRTLRKRLRSTALWGRISHTSTGHLARRFAGWMR